MASGGARATSGPPPDPNALRRDRDAGGWVTLPIEGRPGDPPGWPLVTASEREAELWAGEWKRPQAVMWEKNGQEIEVAIYVRSLVAAEARNAATNLRILVRQQQEALGLSLPGLSRNRWKIGANSAPRTQARPMARARDVFQVVDGGKH